jgi:hypothetical protein
MLTLDGILDGNEKLRGREQRKQGTARTRSKPIHIVTTRPTKTYKTFYQPFPQYAIASTPHEYSMCPIQVLVLNLASTSAQVQNLGLRWKLAAAASRASLIDLVWPSSPI